MRASLLKAFALLVLLVPIAAAGHPDNCRDPSADGDATVLVEPVPLTSLEDLLFTCVEILSGGSVDFRTLAEAGHDVRSVGACFRARDDLGGPMPAMATYRVSLAYGPAGLTRVVDGGSVDCSGSASIESDLEHAHVPYLCHVHQSFRGVIVVRAAL